jgi:hypothetical protein
MKRIIIILTSLLSSVLLCGCATNIDSQAFATLANRITQLEATIRTNATVATVSIKTTDIPTDTDDRKTIWIKLRNESTKPISLRQVNGRWVGEQNEYYSELPTQRTLEKLYAY